MSRPQNYPSYIDEGKSALDVQIGGGYYKLCCMQPIEFIVRADLNFIQGCIVKYITRYKNKNGIEDLNKIIHYCELAIQLYRDSDKRPFIDYALCKQYCKANKLTKTQQNIINSVVRDDYANVILNCKRLIKQEYS